MTNLETGPLHRSVFDRLLELISDSAVYGLSTLLTQIVGFLLLPLYTQYLGPSDYGVLAMLTVVMMTFAPLTSLCLPSAAFRSFNLYKDEAKRGTILTTVALGVAIVSCIALFIGILFAKQVAEILIGDSSATPLVRWSLLTAVFLTLGEVARIDLRSRRRVRIVGALNLTTFFLTAALTIRFVAFDGLGVRGVVWAGLAGAASGALSAFWVTRSRFRLPYDRKEFWSMLSYGWPLVPHRLIAVGLMAYSQYYVRKLLGLDEAGLFDMAAKFALPLGLVVNALQEAWVPYKFQIHSSDENPRHFFRESFTYYLALVLLLWVGTAAWGPEVLRWMTESRFHDAASLIALTAFMRVAWGVYLMMGSGIELSNDTRPYSLISLSGLVVVVATTSLLVPTANAAGAAIATSLGYLTMAYMARTIARTRFHIEYDWPRISYLTTAALLCVFAVYRASSYPLEVRLFVACLSPLCYSLVAIRVLRIPGSTIWSRRRRVTVEAGS